MGQASWEGTSSREKGLTGPSLVSFFLSLHVTSPSSLCSYHGAMHHSEVFIGGEANEGPPILRFLVFKNSELKKSLTLYVASDIL